MSTSTATPAIVRSSSRRQPSYTTPTGDRPQRAVSTITSHSTPPPSYSRSQSQNRGPPTSQQAALASIARKDHETTNVARPSSSRRSFSRDRSTAGPPPTRTDSTRDSRRSTSRPGHSRNNSSYLSATGTAVANGGSAAVQTPGGGRSQSDAAIPGSGGSSKRRTTISAQTGNWSLGKTIGAGSMGKVKLAKSLETGEQVAVKIVPRQSTDEHHNNRDRERADHSKEIRTAREAAIVTLLNHPYICAMRDVVRTGNHWYMLFEYVNGGQMLDYIISHGRLKEKQARKFGRQIASALDYCHRNSIVHRDLKIENILISKTGDIKIIDFGLSNLFSPRSHLKTFCGSLYFAAPELLQARQYTGPEVDIWSFGIVLYVLVCGKVPFDDQSMPQLHAKIKKGVVDYPAWLSNECKSLISRMLVTDPKQRASLQEIMNHPWIIKGFNTPPENYLPHREPIQLPLDPEIVDKMTGFDFGPADFITRELTKVVNSEDYQSAVRLNAREQSAHAAGNEKKRGVFDFYKRRSSITSKETLQNPSAEAVQLGSDPVNAFSPLISIYYLVREKQDRERIEANPGALGMPMSPGEKPLKMPDLPAPEAAYTNSTTYEMPGEKPTGGRSRPRSRTHGEDEVTEGIKKVNLNVPNKAAPIITTPPAEQTPAKKESTAVGLLRRFSTRRNKDSSRGRIDTQDPPSLQLQPPTDAAATTLRKSFSVRRSRNRDPAPTPLLHPGGSTPHQPELLTPPTASRAGNALNRSTSVNSADYRRRESRRGVSEGHTTSVVLDPPQTSGSDRSNASLQEPKTSEPAPAEQMSNNAARAATMRTKSLGSARRESIQARRVRREEVREANVPEETDQELAEGQGETRHTSSVENMKPVYLKGLFSVSTTSNKPLPFIRADIVRVLKQLAVEFTEIKGGFSCRHAPSIDLNRVVDPPSPEQLGMASKASRRISFGGFRNSDRDRDDQEKPSASRRPNIDASYTNSEESDADDSIGRPRRERAAGETTTHVESKLGKSVVLKFEIFVVKVPLFSLHGIQFKKVSGDTWQYKEMAQRILDALRLDGSSVSDKVSFHASTITSDAGPPYTESPTVPLPASSSTPPSLAPPPFSSLYFPTASHTDYFKASVTEPESCSPPPFCPALPVEAALATATSVEAETKAALPPDTKGEPSSKSAEDSEPPPPYTEGPSPLDSFTYVMAAAGGAASIITQVQQGGGAPVTTLADVGADEHITLDLRGTRFTLSRDELLTLPEFVLLSLFPNGLLPDGHMNSFHEGDVYPVDYDPASLQYMLDFFRTVAQTIPSSSPSPVPSPTETSATNSTDTANVPGSARDMLQDRAGIIVLREDLDFYAIPPKAEIDQPEMIEVKRAAGRALLGQDGIFSGLRRSEETGTTEQHLIEMLTAGGFYNDDHWGHRAGEPNKAVICSLALARLRTDIKGNDLANSNAVGMAQKLLLFWRKPARRCWWEGVELDNVDGVEGKLKVWIRRVWTLEMSVIGLR